MHLMKPLPDSKLKIELHVMEEPQPTDLRCKLNHAERQRNCTSSSFHSLKGKHIFLVWSIQWKSEMLDLLKWIEDKLKSQVGIPVESSKLDEMEITFGTAGIVSLPVLINYGIECLERLVELRAITEPLLLEMKEISDSNNLINQEVNTFSKQVEVKWGASEFQHAMTCIGEINELLKKIRDDEFSIQLGVCEWEMKKMAIRYDYCEAMMAKYKKILIDSEEELSSKMGEKIDSCIKNTQYVAAVKADEIMKEEASLRITTHMCTDSIPKEEAVSKKQRSSVAPSKQVCEDNMEECF